MKFLRKIKEYVDLFLNVERTASLRWRADVNRRTVFFSLFVVSLAVFFYVTAFSPPDSFPVDELVSVQEGESVQKIGKDLQAQGVIRSPFLFRALIVVLGRERGARAGDYLFKQPENIWAVAHAVATGN